MPTYAYACAACGHRFEQVQSIHADALTTCPECSGPVRRVISSVGVAFKGSGFYRTDARAESKKAESGKPGSGKPAGEGSGSTSSESKKSAGEGSKSAASAGSSSSGTAAPASGS